MDDHLTAAPADAAVNTYPVNLRINGQPHRFEVEAWVTLLDLLRERAGLTGSKKGCDHGQCGACTVLVGGKRINSCLTLAVMQNGKDITTVEGLADGTRLHPLQQAFIAHDAFQCGYCTPGQLCSAVGLMNEGQAGTVAEVRELMSGNVCRCGAYPGIVAAVTEVMGLPGHKDNPDRPYLPGTVPA
ncbi:xanthine dehydrogenase YagT iron-sulfur-binding subunit [Duganella sp. CF517]|uniref:(2Fe-2S)-binding protein n=1 Tax=Duganella sp. CF517 TaxID=1881038 RepID=UPI0008CFF5C8|nr:(2Fe-2S)-binding protein [Duganella sp. CF517]SEO04544.1 xanthine dehydrogenase YagT iron-sulfur-binding subunit [Duganella sp. CF517]